MKFKIYLTNEIKHKGTVTCVCWYTNEEIYSTSGDHQLYKWNTTVREPIQIAKLPDDFYPTELNWLISRTGGGSSSSKGSDSLLVTSAEGRFILLNKSARVDKNITAHAGPVNSGKWSPDSTSLLTAGEDGVIKIWSRSGMLRSTVTQSDSPIRNAQWSPHSSAIIFSQGSYISIKPLAANSKLTKWRAHDGLVLALAWSSNTDVIASGGEDCRFKIWDNLGSLLYNSTPDDHAITSLDFSPDGKLLAVGGFNMLKLCNYTGWTYSINRFAIAVGSLFFINWSADGTQIVCGSSSGIIIFGHVIEREMIYKNLKAITSGRKTIQVQDIVTRTSDTLDFSERIIKWELGFGHLVVSTVNQTLIYNENYMNTPVIIEGRNDVKFICLGKSNFLIVDNSSIWIYTYNGRLHLNPRYPGSQAQIPHLHSKLISLGLDTMAVRDYADQTLIHIFDLLPGASRQEEPYQIQNKSSLTEISLCRAGNSDDQYLVFIDKNRDLYITSVRSGPDFVIYKIGTQVISVIWSNETNILAGLHDSCYSVWYAPGESCADPTLISLTTVTYDTSDIGKNIALEAFDGSYITFRSSGATFTISIKIYCMLLHKLVYENAWKQAIKLCRMIQNQVSWSTLSAMATKYNQMDISAEAFSASLQIDKVNYLSYIKELPKSSPQQMAESSVVNGRVSEAEIILLHNKKIPEAIAFCIRMHYWDRALDIAEKHKMDLDIVMVEREKYLKALDKDENSPKFLKHLKTQDSNSNTDTNLF